MHKHTPCEDEKKISGIEHRRSKRQRWRDFDLEAKHNMFYDLIVGQQSQQDVARKYCRSQGYVSRELKRYMKNPNMLKETA